MTISSFNKESNVSHAKYIQITGFTSDQFSYSLESNRYHVLLIESFE
jgi:hypothetical protein